MMLSVSLGAVEEKIKSISGNENGSGWSANAETSREKRS